MRPLSNRISCLSLPDNSPPCVSPKEEKRHARQRSANLKTFSRCQTIKLLHTRLAAAPEPAGQGTGTGTHPYGLPSLGSLCIQNELARLQFALAVPHAIFCFVASSFFPARISIITTTSTHPPFSQLFLIARHRHELLLIIFLLCASYLLTRSFAPPSLAVTHPYLSNHIYLNNSLSR